MQDTKSLIKGHSDLERVNGAIINVDDAAYAKRLHIIKRQKELDDMKHRLGNLEEDMKTVKEGLSEILSLLKNH